MEKNTQQIQLGELIIPEILREYMEMAGNMEKSWGNLRRMEEEPITQKELETEIKALKAGKAVGPDKMKPEFLKAMQGSNECVEDLLECLNHVLKEGEIPYRWRESRAILIPKVKEPEVKDIRPIMQTNVTYKQLVKIM